MRSIPRRVHTLNHHFFDEITDEARAYWLGFITGDGSVSKGYLQVSASPKDRDILESLQYDLEASAPIRTHERLTPFAKNESGRMPICCFSIGSVQLIASLAKHGIAPRKTFSVEPWVGCFGPLGKHYWRGLIDADGWVLPRSGSWEIGLCGNHSIVSAFSEFATISCGTHATVRPDKGIWTISIKGVAMPRRLANTLYGEATVSLERKWRTAKEIIVARDKVTYQRNADGLWTVPCHECGALRLLKHHPRKVNTKRCRLCRSKSRATTDSREFSRPIEQ